MINLHNGTERHRERRNNIRRFALLAAQFTAQWRNFLLRVSGLCVFRWSVFYRGRPLYEVPQTPADYQAAAQRCSENPDKMDSPKAFSLTLETKHWLHSSYWAREITIWASAVRHSVMASTQSHCDLFLSFGELQMVACTQLPLFMIARRGNLFPRTK